MVEEHCPNCHQLVKADTRGRCPLCGAQLPRFHTHTTIVPDAGAPKSRKAHPDPIKQKEAQLAAQFAAQLIAWFEEKQPTEEGFLPSDYTFPEDAVLFHERMSREHGPKRIVVVGYAGVGKTTFLTLLTGGTPPSTFPFRLDLPIPIEGTSLAGYRIVASEPRTRGMEGLILQQLLRWGHLVLLVTDSTLENVLNSKDVVDQIHRMEKRDAYFRSPRVLAIANKQDLPGALSPAFVQHVLGVKTFGRVSNRLDAANRQSALDIIKDGLASGTLVAAATESALLKRPPLSSEPPEIILRKPPFGPSRKPRKAKRKPAKEAASKPPTELPLPEDLKRALDLPPGDPRREALTLAGLELGRTGSVHYWLRRAMDLEEEDRAYLLEGIARSLGEQGELTDAMSVASAIENEQQRLKTLAGVAEALARAGRIREAVEIASTLGDADTASRVKTSIVIMLARNNRVYEALDLLRQIEVMSWRPEAVGEICAALVRDHRIPQALELFGKVADEERRTVILVPVIPALVKDGKASMALALIANIENRHARAILVAKVAGALVGQQQLKQALEVTKRLEEAPLDALVEIARGFAELGDVERANRLIENLKETGSRQKALEFIKKALAKRKRLSDSETRIPPYYV